MTGNVQNMSKPNNLLYVERIHIYQYKKPLHSNTYKTLALNNALGTKI